MADEFSKKFKKIDKSQLDEMSVADMLRAISEDKAPAIEKYTPEMVKEEVNQHLSPEIIEKIEEAHNSAATAIIGDTDTLLNNRNDKEIEEKNVEAKPKEHHGLQLEDLNASATQSPDLSQESREQSDGDERD